LIVTGVQTCALPICCTPYACCESEPHEQELDSDALVSRHRSNVGISRRPWPVALGVPRRHIGHLATRRNDAMRAKDKRDPTVDQIGRASCRERGEK